MAFPMLSGHFSFSTHRYWTVFLRRAVYCATEAWRRTYGQIATAQESHFQEKLQSKLPDVSTTNLPGWKVDSRGRETV